MPHTLLHPLLSCYQAKVLLEARQRAQTQLELSFDLGRTQRLTTLDQHGITAPIQLPWASVEEIASVDSVCFSLREGAAVPLRIFSEASQHSFQLWPTSSAPALLISGFTMHRLRDVGPYEGAALMVRALGKLRGRVLDTTTGLGYAAIAAARDAAHVTTIELEPAVRELTRLNPWSAELFDNPKIHRLEGESSQLVPTLEPGSFSAIISDPPAINLAGELYSGTFYAALRRVLTRHGKLFHYIGDANSASGGRTTRGVVKRLTEAGFSRVTVVKEAFGVLATA